MKKVLALALCVCMEPIFEGRNHMYKVEKKNRVLRIPDEKFDEYKKMGYIIRDENDNATLYAEDADKKITKLQKENDELKAAIQAQATMRAVAPTSEDSEKKPAAKGSKKTE